MTSQSVSILDVEGDTHDMGYRSCARLIHCQSHKQAVTSGKIYDRLKVATRVKEQWRLIAAVRCGFAAIRRI